MYCRSTPALHAPPPPHPKPFHPAAHPHLFSEKTPKMGIPTPFEPNIGTRRIVPWERLPGSLCDWPTLRRACKGLIRRRRTSRLLFKLGLHLFLPRRVPNENGSHRNGSYPFFEPSSYQTLTALLATHGEASHSTPSVLRRAESYLVVSGATVGPNIIISLAIRQCAA